MNNKSKYLSYTKAWEKINAALNAGFHLEAITIEESIISDRLLSYVLGVIPNSKVGTRSGLGELISQWRKHAGASLIRSDGTDLGLDTFLWKEKRNTAVHGLVKSHPRTATMCPDDFFVLAREAAEEGMALAREIQNWHKKTLRKAKA